MTEDLRLKRLTYRAHHRGFKEADLLIGSFVDKHLTLFTPAQLDDLEALLDEQDQDIYEWYLGRAEVPPHHDTPVFKMLKSFEFFPQASWN
jgi:antitoxin CptB